MARDPHLDQFLKVFQRAAQIAAQAVPSTGNPLDGHPLFRGQHQPKPTLFDQLCSGPVKGAWLGPPPVSQMQPIGDPPERMKEAVVLSVRTEPIDPDEP